MRERVGWERKEKNWIYGEERERWADSLITNIVHLVGW